MGKIDPFSENSVEQLAKVLGDCGTGTEISNVLARCDLEDRSGESTKWKRLKFVFLESQRQYGCANKILHFIRYFLDPVRFVGDTETKEYFETQRRALNKILAFSGLEFSADGQFLRREAARTLDEAERRFQSIQGKLKERNIHVEVRKYCRVELMQNNYFHAVFEATKGLAERIREMSGVDKDGTRLVDEVFSSNQPLLAFNPLRTETQKSEHRGFAALLKGCFQAIRNPLAHEPKIHWEGEDNAADYLSLISLLHRKLDECELVSRRDETSPMLF